MNISDIKDYLPYAINFNTENLKTGIVPGEVPPVRTTNGVSVYVYDKKETAKIVDELFGDSDDEQNTDGTEDDNTIQSNVTSTDEGNIVDNTEIEEDLSKGITIELLNGTDNENALFNVKNKLEANGYEIVKTDETNLTSKTTIINRTDLSDDSLGELKNILGKGITSSGSDNEIANVTIIIGEDY